MHGIRVLREKLLIRHADPRTREITRELEIRNETDGPQTEFLMVLNRFLPGLWIEDGTSRRLAVLPKSLLEEQTGPQDELIKDLTGADAGGRYALLIYLADKLERGRSEIIRLHFEDEHSRDDWRLIPHHWFESNVSKAPDEHDTFIEIRSPPESTILLQGRHGLPTPPATRDEAGIRITLLPRFVQIRCPGRHPGISFRYRVKPVPSEEALVRIPFHLLWLTPAFLLLAGSADLMEWRGAFVVTIETTQGPVTSIIENDVGRLVGGLGIAGLVSIVAFIRPIWTNRAWYLWPLSLNLVLLALSLT